MTMTAPREDSPAEASAIAAANPQRRVDRITLENGIILRLKPVPPMVLRAASAGVKKPEVPIVLIPEKGRDEPNPNDPQYLADLQQWFANQAEALLTVALILGTAVEFIPEGMHGADDDEWIAELREAYGLLAGSIPPIHEERGSKARYLDWLHLYAIPSETDIHRLTRLLTSGVALTESEVQAAADSFRRLFAGFSSLGDAPAGAAVDGDRDPGPDPGPAA